MLKLYIKSTVFWCLSEVTGLHALAQLPKSTRCVLFKGLQDIMIDRSDLTCWQSVVRDAKIRPPTSTFSFTLF